MKVFKKKSNLIAYLNTIKQKKSLGFVPTMGALHSGHLKLIETSKIECEITICSIFVNPIQFNNRDDFKNYPNTIKRDLKELQKINCDIVYKPNINDIYYKGEKAKEFDFGSLTKTMEGKYRLGHFDGMATIIEKFFNIIKPHKAFFGQKDLQQLQIVKELAKQMDFNVKIKGVSTIREKNGLAKSSRNKLLSKENRSKAALIYHCLNYCLKNKAKGVENLRSYIHSKFTQQKDLKLEYAEIVNLKNMLPIKKWEKEKENAICIAAYIDGVRLIDNIIL